ncbi:hypothetical protein [Serratia fonticola]|uniref:hypothetical protein n=1 Tax=Serratia fonticola TaxID=47917 RepID=UPI00215D769D|nr:hypothetical protein [Serratia fonticola]
MVRTVIRHLGQLITDQCHQFCCVAQVTVGVARLDPQVAQEAFSAWCAPQESGQVFKGAVEPLNAAARLAECVSNGPDIVRRGPGALCLPIEFIQAAGDFSGVANDRQRRPFYGRPQLYGIEGCACNYRLKLAAASLIDIEPQRD